ncbi:MAG: RecQ family ATP-dependent DNA helicase [Flavobacteriales bacterium]
MNTPLQILEKHWGFSSFKSRQEAIIDSVLNGQDTVALLPTGGGKSICFQIPALLNEGICIVVSPLIALISDQVKSLQNKGIKALALKGGLSFDELRTLLDNATHGNYKFLYLSPERLQQEMVQNYIKKMNVNTIAVDEAHCISQWGSDFRPAYKNITILRELHPLVPIIALTATATPKVLEHTIEELKLELPNIFKDSFVRKNIAYQVIEQDDKLYQIERLLKRNTGSAIVYVRSRKAAVEIHNQLNSLGFRSAFYHGGLSADDKDRKLEAWQNNSISIMVATNAFGMGIDHPNVRFVIHVQLPESLESYFQEAGRAGRDGARATAVLLHNAYDKILVRKQFIDSLATPVDLKKIYRSLVNYFRIAYGEGMFSEHSFSFTDFCTTYKLNTFVAYNALNTLDRLAIIQLSKEFGRKTTISFTVSSETLLSYFERDIVASVIGKTILRLYGGIFDSPTKVNLELVAKKSGQKISVIISVLKKMEREELLELSLHITDASLTFLVPREDDKTINVVAKEVEVLNTKKTDQVEAVLKYVANDSECRSLQLVRYFGELNKEPCGICSVCNTTAQKLDRNEARLMAKDILSLLKQDSLNSRQISEALRFTESLILQVLKLLLDAEKICINEKNKYSIK